MEGEGFGLHTTTFHNSNMMIGKKVEGVEGGGRRVCV